MIRLYTYCGTSGSSCRRATENGASLRRRTTDSGWHEIRKQEGIPSKLPSLSSLSLALGQRLGDNGTARLYRGSHTGSPRPPSSPAAPTVRVVPLALIPSRPHQLLPIFLGEFSPLDDPKAKTEKIGAFRVFFKV